MYLDFLNYQKYYETTIGKSLSDHIENKLKKYCYLYDHQKIGCFGFSHPYTKFVSKNNLDINYCNTKKMGLSKVSGLLNKQILIDEEHLPFQDSFFDHVFLIHYLENTLNLKTTIREIWRTLAPEGKCYVIIPNKNSSWSMSANSPFSSGLSFTKRNVENLFKESFFDIQFIERLVYFPNYNSNFIKNNKFFFDKIGSVFFRYLNAVHLYKKKKRVYAETNNLPARNYIRKFASSI